MRKVVALIDRPSPQSMAMVPLIVRLADGSLATSGMAKASRHRSVRSEEEVLALEYAGHIRLLAEPLPTLPPDGEFCALWMGSQFSLKAHIRFLPLPAPADSLHTVSALGVFWLGYPQVIYPRLIEWMRTAFRAAVVSRIPQIAQLMNWVLPDQVEAMAALWYTADTSEMKQRYLDQFRQTFRTRLSEKELKSELKSTVEHVLGHAIEEE